MATMKELIDKIKSRYASDEEGLQAYLEHIQKSSLPGDDKGHWHHILPRSMFPEFGSRIAYPWNQAKLSPSDHWMAHYLLYKAVRCQAAAYAWKLMNKARESVPNKECLEEYERALLTVADSCGHTMRGMVAAKDKNGDILHVKSTDPRLIDGTLSHFAKGTVNVKDRQGRCFKVSREDPRYLSGEIVHVRKGRVTAKDGGGTVVDTTCDDPRFATGELTHINKGYVLAVGRDGVYRRVSVSSPEYLSGELLHARTGHSPSGSPVLPNTLSRQCPKCDKTLAYGDKYHCKAAEEAKRLCKGCAANKRYKLLYAKRERVCPSCRVILHYTQAWACGKAERERKTCRVCSSKARAIRLRWPQTRWEHENSSIMGMGHGGEEER